ncbi:MAG: PKD-like domain-containing protein [Mucinivorans sp.]
MKKTIYSLILLLTVSLLSCTKVTPEIINPRITIQADDKPATQGLSMPQNGSLNLNAKVELTTQYTLSWSVDGKPASTDSRFKFTATEIGEHTILLNVLNNDGGKASASLKVTVYENLTVRITLDGKDPEAGLSIPYFKSLSFGCQVKPEAQYTFSWQVNKESVSDKVNYTFNPQKAGEYQIILSATNQYGAIYADTTEVNVFDFSKGTFVLNEGNMTTEQGSMIFISPRGTIIDSTYWRVNGTSIGSVAQDISITGNKMYIISQNGGGDGMLVVANATTLKKEEGYSKGQLSPLAWPTHIAVVGDNAYIRDNKGVYKFSLTSKTLTFIKGSERAAKNRMAVIADKVFIPAGRNIYVLKDGALIHTIEMAGTVSGVIKSSDNNLWVACTTTPARISKIKPSDYTTIQTNELPTDAKVGAGWGVSPGISAHADTIYFSNATTKISRHIFNQNKTEYLTDVKNHIQNAGIVYNNLAVHPATGELYFTTIKGYGLDFLINDIVKFDFSGPSPVMKADHKNYTRFPAGIFFTDSFK